MQNGRWATFSWPILYIFGDKDRQLHWPSKCGSYLQLSVALQDNKAQDLLGFRISGSWCDCLYDWSTGRKFFVCTRQNTKHKPTSVPLLWYKSTIPGLKRCDIYKTKSLCLPIRSKRLRKITFLIVKMPTGCKFSLWWVSSCWSLLSLLRISYRLIWENALVSIYKEKK